MRVAELVPLTPFSHTPGGLFCVGSQQFADWGEVGDAAGYDDLLVDDESRRRHDAVAGDGGVSGGLLKFGRSGQHVRGCDSAGPTS
jgi:hypothetical protein